MNILSTEAELFAIRYSISWASKIQGIIYIPLPYQVIWGSSLIGMITTQFFSGIFLVITNGLLIYWLTKNQNVIRWILYYLENYHRNLVKKKNVILLSKGGRCTSKYQTMKKTIFLIWIMMTINLFILSSLKVMLNWNTSAHLTHCVYTSQELLQIMLPLVNTDKKFSLIGLLYTHVAILL